MAPGRVPYAGSGMALSILSSRIRFMERESGNFHHLENLLGPDMAQMSRMIG
jgi:hypothetical protein